MEVLWLFLPYGHRRRKNGGLVRPRKLIGVGGNEASKRRLPCKIAPSIDFPRIRIPKQALNTGYPDGIQAKGQSSVQSSLTPKTRCNLSQALLPLRNGGF